MDDGPCASQWCGVSRSEFRRASYRQLDGPPQAGALWKQNDPMALAAVSSSRQPFALPPLTLPSPVTERPSAHRETENRETGAPGCPFGRGPERHALSVADEQADDSGRRCFWPTHLCRTVLYAARRPLGLRRTGNLRFPGALSSAAKPEVARFGLGPPCIHRQRPGRER